MGNRQYQSTVFHRIYNAEGQGKQEYFFGLNMLADIFAPVKEMGDDFMRAFRRPQSQEDWLAMAATPVNGVVNFFVGVFDVAMVVKQIVLSLVSIASIFVTLVTSLFQKDGFDESLAWLKEEFGLQADNDYIALLEALGTALVAPFMLLGLGLMGMFRGVTQVLATPLVALELLVHGVLGFRELKVKLFRKMAPELMKDFAVGFLNADEKMMYDGIHKKLDKNVAGAAFATCVDRYNTLGKSMEGKAFKTLVKEKKGLTLVFVLESLAKEENRKEQKDSANKSVIFNENPKNCSELFTLFDGLKLTACTKAGESWGTINNDIKQPMQDLFKQVDKYHGLSNQGS